MFRQDKFNITAASEIMALFCLATSLDDLKEKGGLGKILIGLMVVALIVAFVVGLLMLLGKI